MQTHIHTPKTLTSIQINTLSLNDPWQWLKQGWLDCLAIGSISWLHGLVCCLFGWILLILAYDKFWLLSGAFSGFLLVAPSISSSLYALSKSLMPSQPLPPSVAPGSTIANMKSPERTLTKKHSRKILFDTWFNWQRYRKNDPSSYWVILRFSLLLALAGTGWVICSASLIILLTKGQVQTPFDFIHHVLLSAHDHVFEVWLLVGGLLAAPIFASSVITIPLLLDSNVSLSQAVHTSIRIIAENPFVMALWAGIIMFIVAFGLLTALLGLIVAVPLLGHASWHAYCACVDRQSVPKRFAT